MPWAIYGKRTQPITNTETGEVMGPDTRFAALDYKGIRVSKLENAGTFAEKADAEDYLQQHPVRTGVEVEIRKVK